MKTKISITIESDLLQQVESLVDGSLLKNTSHVIEFLCKEAIRLLKLKKQCDELFKDIRRYGKAGIVSGEVYDKGKTV